jgi:hypothetical protein
MANRYYFRIVIDQTVEIVADSSAEAYEAFNDMSTQDICQEWYPELCFAEDENGEEIEIGED